MGVAPMGVKYRAAAQTGCQRGDGGGKLGGMDRDSSEKERTKVRAAESICICFTSYFWRVLVKERPVPPPHCTF